MLQTKSYRIASHRSLLDNVPASGIAAMHD